MPSPLMVVILSIVSRYTTANILHIFYGSIMGWFMIHNGILDPLSIRHYPLCKYELSITFYYPLFPINIHYKSIIHYGSIKNPKWIPYGSASKFTSMYHWNIRIGPLWIVCPLSISHSPLGVICLLH